MSLQNLKRWHWILISLVLGLVLGNIRHFALSPDLDTSRGSMTQRVFEDTLVRHKRAVDAGNPAVSIKGPIVVTRIVHPRDKTKFAHKVDLHYWSGLRGDIKRTDDGQAGLQMRPMMLIAPIPYHPRGAAKPVEAHMQPSKLQKLAEALRLRPKDEPHSVLDYLAQVAPTHGVKFEYKWHHDRKVQMAGWTAASFVLVGLIWPTLVNLMYFGSIWRPKEEEGIDLSKVSSRSPSTAQGAPTISQGEHDKLAALEADLQAKLGDFGANTVSSGGAPAAASEEDIPAPVIRPLSAAPPVESAFEEKEDDREFKQKDDDFYPTERRAKPKE